jgi:2-keto-4-pentenoate hydratase/2-oxohepta-3-ene-1,7-dioic acid hydratase in catechol pathway
VFYPKKINQSGAIIGQYDWPTSKIICVGRNYAAHAKELNNPIPETPLLFIKSTNTLIDCSDQIGIPKGQGECQHELEIAILIGKQLTKANRSDSLAAIEGVGLALDLTLRELQSELKSKGQPWEKAKSFDGACPVTGFIPFDQSINLSDIQFGLLKNGDYAQQGNSKEMLFDIIGLIQQISKHFSLYPGDIILTGTPQGVASLNSGDKISLELQQSQITQATITHD